MEFFSLKVGKNYRRFLLAFTISWLFAASLGFVFALYSMLAPEANSNTTFESNLSEVKSLSIKDLWVMAIIPVALLISSICAVIVTPLAIWTLRTGKRNLIIYGTILWVLLALYIVLGLPSFFPSMGVNRLIGVVFLSVLGLIVIGLIPPRQEKFELKTRDILFLLIIGIIFGYSYFNESTKFPWGPLSKIQNQINSEAGVVNKNGSVSKIEFIIPDENGILIISPPACRISEKYKDVFSKELLEKIDYMAIAPTGHMFYINQNHLIDYRALNYLCEPVWGIGKKKNLEFVLSQNKTQNHLIKVELVEK